MTDARPMIDEVLAIVDDVFGKNPWIRLGVSAGAGFVVGLGGSSLLRSGLRLALTLSAKRLARYGFDVAFDAGHRHAAERSY